MISNILVSSSDLSNNDIRSSCNIVSSSRKKANIKENEKAEEIKKEDKLNNELSKESEEPKEANETFLGKTRKDYKDILKKLNPVLELYDIVRKVRKIDSPEELNNETDLSKSGLRIDLSCPICMGILQHTVVVKDCFHRFCADCIEKCVRTGIRECPQCRIHVASRRSLRPDPIFDQIIRRLFLDVKQFECSNYKLVEEANKKRSFRFEGNVPDYTSDSDCSRSSSQDKDFKRRSPGKRAVYIEANGKMQLRNDYSCFPWSESPASFSSLHAEQKGETRRKRKEWEAEMKRYPSDGNLRFIFFPDPSLPDLPLLKPNQMITRGQLTLNQLSKNLGKRLGMEHQSEMRFYTKECRELFQPGDTLAFLHHKSLGLTHEYLVVYYTTRGDGYSNLEVLGGKKGCAVKVQHSSSYASAAEKESDENLATAALSLFCASSSSVLSNSKFGLSADLANSFSSSVDMKSACGVDGKVCSNSSSSGAARGNSSDDRIESSRNEDEISRRRKPPDNFCENVNSADDLLKMIAAVADSNQQLLLEKKKSQNATSSSSLGSDNCNSYKSGNNIKFFDCGSSSSSSRTYSSSSSSSSRTYSSSSSSSSSRTYSSSSNKIVNSFLHNKRDGEKFASFAASADNTTCCDSSKNHKNSAKSKTPSKLGSYNSSTHQATDSVATSSLSFSSIQEAQKAPLSSLTTYLSSSVASAPM